MSAQASTDLVGYDTTSDEVETYLREHIPLSGDMGVRVLDPGPDRVVLEAPLEPNLNHRATAFGGSVAAVAMLAGWALVHFRLKAEGVAAETVIHRGDMRYDAPIQGPFRALCARVADGPWQRFTKAIVRHGRGRIGVVVTVEVGGGAVATLGASYVALAGSGG